MIDGNYIDTLGPRAERADTMVYLDLPTWQCMLRVVGRTVLHYGRVAVITGASSGIGAEAATALAAKGAKITLAVQDQGRGDAIPARMPKADATVSLVDMANLVSVRAFAERVAGTCPGSTCC